MKWLGIKGEGVNASKLFNLSNIKIIDTKYGAPEQMYFDDTCIEFKSAKLGEKVFELIFELMQRKDDYIEITCEEKFGLKWFSKAEGKTYNRE